MDVFRKVYKPISEVNSLRVTAIKDKAQELYDLIAAEAPAYPDEPGAPERGRSISIAKTKLEEAIMWAVKGTTV